MVTRLGRTTFDASSLLALTLMTKAELIERIARSRELPPEVTKKIVAKVLDLAFTELAAYFVRARVTRSASPRFTYPKFGTFTKKRRSGRRGINPRTLEPMEIEACETVDFKPSVEFKQKLNEPAAPVATPAGRKKKAVRSSSKKSKRSALAGPGGRKLATRDEAEPEAVLLPEPPLQKVARRRRSAIDETGS